MFSNCWPYLGQFMAECNEKHKLNKGPSKKLSFLMLATSNENYNRCSVLKFSNFLAIFGRSPKKHLSDEGPSKEHPYYVWLKSVKRNMRSRLFMIFIIFCHILVIFGRLPSKAY